MSTLPPQPDNVSNSPLGREFAVYIKGQYASRVAGLHTQARSAEDINDHEEPILVRSFFYRIMRTTFLRNGRADDPNSDFVSAATAHRWATLDAMDFRDLNRVDRDSCIHCAEIICANPSPFYRRALEIVAADVLEIAHAAVREDKAQRRPLPVPADDGQGVLTLSAPPNDQRPALRLASTQHQR